MADAHHAAASRQLRMLFEGGTVVGLSDGQLLELFAARRDEAAFTALVERHGPMVRRVCGEVLGNHHDAEDAFQAAFLVLARQVGSIRHRDSLASWLYGVALRVSACARSASARRRSHERNWGALRAAQRGDESESREDLGPLLHAEIGRLAERYRAPVVLCYLEGRTCEEAARLLHCPVGTIKSRLATARRQLRQQLERLEPVGLAESIERDQGIAPVLAAVPAGLVETTVRAATQGAAGGTVSVAVARLVEGVLKAMFLNRLSAAAALIVVAALATGASGWAWQTTRGQPAPVEARADNPSPAQPLIRAPEPQTPARAGGLTNLEGLVVDEQGKPVPDARVFFYAPPPQEGNVDAVELGTQSDAGGQFRLANVPQERASMIGVYVWAYRAGRAIASAWSARTPLKLVLQKPQPRTLKLEGADGRPIAGAVVSPLAVYEGVPFSELPETMVRQLFVTTGPDGQAGLNGLRGASKLVAVRVTTASTGTQDLQLLANPQDVQAATITVRLKPTNHLAGHVRTAAGEPVGGLTVEVWHGGSNLLTPSPVGFRTGPVRTAADGSFRTPDNLLVGSQYRVAVRAPGFEPILSRWITIGQEPRVLLPLIQRPLRTLSGRVVDRQSRPLANVEVLQSGDGPERTATRTGADGRFALGGFIQGPVFLFARREGFRFFGRLVRPGDGEITLELTRISERPTREMRMLPEPIPLEESRTLARRLIEPYWKAAVVQKDQTACYQALVCLVPADPSGVLERLDAEESVPLTPTMNRILRSRVAGALARTDLARAREVAETLESPVSRCTALVAVADAQPPEDRERKLAVLARAERLAKEAKSRYAEADVAERWYELGEKDRARALFAESVRLGKESTLYDYFAAIRLARFDLPAALAIAKELPVIGDDSARLYRNNASRLAAESPAEAERVLRLVPHKPRTSWLPPAVVWKMAASDPARAWRLADEAQRDYDHPQIYLFLALGLKPRDPAAAERAFWKAIQGIDRQIEEGVESPNTLGPSWLLLPLVEQIDPALVPELFWRGVAARPPIGNPRTLFHRSPTGLAFRLGWYDREVAAAVFDPVRTDIEQTDERTLTERDTEFQSWSIFDPRATAARLEQLPVSTELGAREIAGMTLGLAYKDRWRQLWSQFTEMRDVLERDIR